MNIRIRSLVQYPLALALLLAGQLASAQAGYETLSDAPSGTYALEKTHAYVAISYSHQGFSRPILLFRDFDATLEFNAEKLAASALTVNIDPDSIDSGVDEFDEHLVGADMFDVDKFPEAAFVATNIREIGNGSFKIDGELTLKGVTKALTLDARFNKGGVHFKLNKPHLGFSATAVLKRSEWDLGYAVPFVGDDVAITIEVEFMKEADPA